MNVVCVNNPEEPLANDGLFEKLYSAFLALTKKYVDFTSSSFLAWKPNDVLIP